VTGARYHLLVRSMFLTLISFAVAAALAIAVGHYLVKDVTALTESSLNAAQEAGTGAQDMIDAAVSAARQGSSGIPDLDALPGDTDTPGASAEQDVERVRATMLRLSVVPFGGGFLVAMWWIWTASSAARDTGGPRGEVAMRTPWLLGLTLLVIATIAAAFSAAGFPWWGVKLLDLLRTAPLIMVTAVSILLSAIAYWLATALSVPIERQASVPLARLVRRTTGAPR
jgi:hypothetical protein